MDITVFLYVVCKQKKKVLLKELTLHYTSYLRITSNTDQQAPNCLGKASIEIIWHQRKHKSALIVSKQMFHGSQVIEANRSSSTLRFIYLCSGNKVLRLFIAHSIHTVRTKNHTISIFFI
jgi:hypothetical protein